MGSITPSTNETSAGLSSANIVEEKQATPTPPQRTGLLDLPDKALLQIIEEGDFQRKHIRALALACSRLFRLAQRQFYLADEFATFASAAAHGDIAALERCVKFGGAPKTTPITVVAACGDLGSIRAPCNALSVSLIDAVSRNMQIGKVSPKDCLTTAQWLLEHMENTEAYLGHALMRRLEYEPWVSEDEFCQSIYCSRRKTRDYLKRGVLGAVLLQLMKRQSREKVEATCELIELLVKYGAKIPRVEIPWSPSFPEGNDEILSLPMQEKLLCYDRHPIAFAMLLHCPPSILELVLKTYQRENYNLVSHRDDFYDYPPGGKVSTSVDLIVRSIHTHIFMPMGDWKEAYHGEVADILKKKIDLFIQYDAMSPLDAEVLQRLVTAVRDVYSHVEAHGVELERTGKTCWDILWKAIWPSHLSNMMLSGRNHRFLVTLVKYDTPWSIRCHDDEEKCSNNDFSPQIEWQYLMEWLQFQKASTKCPGIDIRRQFWESARCNCGPCQRRPVPKKYNVLKTEDEKLEWARAAIRRSLGDQIYD